jgi:hypothetical protein
MNYTINDSMLLGAMTYFTSILMHKYIAVKISILF